VSQHKEQQGFVTFAVNTPEVNYGELAYLQCLNVKATQQNNRYAVIVDVNTYESFTEQQLNTFDYVIQIGVDRDNPFSAEPTVWHHTPFKETIKLESDLLFTRSIDHWWTTFRLKNVCLSTHARTANGTMLQGFTRYRELFEANQLPDVYNGLMYFRYTQEAHDFFLTARNIFENWDIVKTELIRCDVTASTDVVYAIAALILGEDVVTMPSMDFLNFVHMKSGFNGWSDARTWLETVVNERDGDIIRINNLNQYHPVHYYDKTYCTKELIKYYEQRFLDRS
jgi:hypothetical protein